MESNSHDDNDWAKNADSVELHISQAKSGQQDYFCIGCHAEMSAKKSKNELRYKSHFAHVATDVRIERKCTFSSETYRHKIAKEILQRLKCIKVPALKVFSGDSRKCIVLKEAHFIHAHSTKVELPVFEDEKGSIIHGKSKEHSDRHLLFQPDVTFFDKNGNVLLLIELVVENKLKNDKLFKIRSIGIDTVQVVVPRFSSEEIEKALQVTKYTKWVYNNEQETANFEELQSGVNSKISEIDEFERKLFERSQSLRCRVSEINNFIRRLTKSVESEQFDQSRKHFRAEIQRVEENSENERRNIEQERNAIEVAEGEIEKEEEFRIADNRKRIEVKRTFINQSERKFRVEIERKQGKIDTRYSNLEGRYTLKRIKLIEEERYLEQEEARFRTSSHQEIEGIEKYLTDQGAEPQTMAELVKRIEIDRGHKTSEFEASERKLNRTIESTRTKIETIRIELKNLPNEFRNREENLRIEFEGKRKELIDRFKRLREDAIIGFKEEDFKQLPRLATQLESVFSGRGLFDVEKDTSDQFERLKKVRKAIENKSYKSWT